MKSFRGIRLVLPVFLFLGILYYFRDSFVTTQPKLRLTKGYASLSLVTDEILVELMQESGSLHEILAVTNLVDDRTYTSITSEVASQIPYRSNDSIEKLIALGPEVVFTASFNRLSLIEPLKKSGIKTVNLSSFNSLEDLFGNYRTIAKVLHKEEAAKRVLRRLSRSLDDLKARYGQSPKKTILMILEDGTVLGSQTLMNDVLSVCSGKNVFDEESFTGWFKPSLEVLASLNPDWILTSSSKKNKAREILSQHPVLKNFSAVKEERIIFLSQRKMSTQSSYIASTVRKICKVLHD